MEEIRDRVKKIRETLNLSQAAFGEKVSLERSAISLIERKQRNITERSIKDICREFNVDYIWLTTGEGEMFSDSDQEVIQIINRVLADEDDFTKRVFRAFAKMDARDWEALRKFIDAVSNQKNEQ